MTAAASSPTGPGGTAETTSSPAPRIVPTSPLYRFGRMMLRPWADLWFDLKVYGLEHIPPRGGVLVSSNHQSYLDPIVLGVKVTNRPYSFLAKSELFENPFFGWLIRSLNAFPVRQGEGDVGAVKETIRRLQEGHALIVYPEGTRSPTAEIEPLQAGIGLIIRRAGVPVVPAVIDGSFGAWPRGHKVFRPHPVRVMYGPAMDLKDLKAAEIVRRIEAKMREMHAELRRRDPVLAAQRKRLLK